MKSIKRKIRREDGFTLIEMLIVIMIISILLILVVTNLGGVNGTITETKNDGIIQTVDSQKLIYEMKNGVKPSAEKLRKENFITKKQEKAYDDAINSDKKSD